MWQTGKPQDSGWYLGAWKMGETYIYQVAKWTGTEWYSSMKESPTTWMEIDCPELQYEMLNELNPHTMKRNNKTWTPKEMSTLRKRFQNGSTDEQIATELGRTASAIQQRRVGGGYRRKGKGPTLKAGAKYTRYMKPSTEVSILWGLVKFSKA